MQIYYFIITVNFIITMVSEEKSKIDNNTLIKRIQAEIEDNTFTVTFKDSGKPFDPLKHSDPDTTLGSEERGIGGLGILLVKKNMDEVSYDYADGKNIFTMRKIIR